MAHRPTSWSRGFALVLTCAAGCCGDSLRVTNYPFASGCDRCAAAPPATARFNPLPAGPTTIAAQPPSPANGLPNAEAGIRLAPPEGIGSDISRDYARQYPPQTPEPPVAAIPPQPGGGSPATPALPVDIPQFAIVKKGVASGQQPFSDGWSWLQAHGYKTVLHVRPPDESDSAAERIVTRRGLKYLSLEVSPTTLSREIVERFSRIVSDEANQPLFVFDRDGSLAGGLWYLHFRLVDKLSDEKARAEAARLGFREDGAHRTMWIAVQKYLRDQTP
jgi:protein tyrosine phosphatase (PTP) superfamily phosphohydrolase (DUF442 family)